MKVLVHDEAQKRASQIADALEKKRHTVKACSGTGDFMTVIEEWRPDKIIMDVETWRKDTPMLNYFQFAKKIERIPLLFYNAEEGFSVDGFRSPAEKDRILPRPTKVEQIIATFEQVP
jgi:DNA-binding response OmpR family regulator